jgi:hypothetical protein
MRSARSWPTMRSRYRNTPREMPNARTPTAAGCRYSTGGASAANEISHAETPMSATDDADASAASSTLRTSSFRPFGTSRRRSRSSRFTERPPSTRR